ncbi:MAG TPA: hypothetical protein VMR41_02920 [Patescibacteria group bacterium]|nr:hypothetical protein [Patescibacteria group bacterium]
MKTKLLWVGFILFLMLDLVLFILIFRGQSKIQSNSTITLENTASNAPATNSFQTIHGKDFIISVFSDIPGIKTVSLDLASVILPLYQVFYTKPNNVKAIHGDTNPQLVSVKIINIYLVSQPQRDGITADGSYNTAYTKASQIQSIMLYANNPKQSTSALSMTYWNLFLHALWDTSVAKPKEIDLTTYFKNNNTSGFILTQ